MNRLIIPMLLALVACAPAPVAPPPAPAAAVLVTPMPPPPPPCPPPSPVDELFDYYQRLRLISAADLQKEQALQQAAPQPRGDAWLIRQAMLTTVSRTGGEWSRLLAQLDVLQKTRDDASAPFRPVAALMHALISEQRRLDEQNEKISALLRDEQKRREGLEEREAALQEKLEGLKAIERNLLNRPQGKKP